MKISEMVSRLEMLKDKHGDLPVLMVRTPHNEVELGYPDVECAEINTWERYEINEDLESERIVALR